MRLAAGWTRRARGREELFKALIRSATALAAAPGEDLVSAISTWLATAPKSELKGQ
jgi:hypothetical protein